MKKFFMLCLIVSLLGVMTVGAEDAAGVSYTFGDVPQSVTEGEIVSVPVYLTITGTPVNSVLMHMSFDETVFEFQSYKSSTDKGTHNLNFAVVGITQSDSSVVSGIFVSSDGNTTSEFSSTLLCSLRFKVLENAQAGEYDFNIVKSQVKCNSIGIAEFSSEEYVAETLKVTVADMQTGVLGDVDGDGKITVLDACRIMKHIADIEQISDITRADVDGDGEIAVTDATQLLKYIARLINEL